MKFGVSMWSATTVPIFHSATANNLIIENIFNPNISPVVLNSYDSGAHTGLELGLNFTPAVNGYVTGVKFYKGSNNTGTHIGNLWSANGTLLNTVVFAGETASGWQNQAFPSQTAVIGGNIYVISYHLFSNYYAADAIYNWPVVSGDLTAPAGNNGVYSYGSANSVFPTNVYNSANYWVDVDFVKV